MNYQNSGKRIFDLLLALALMPILLLISLPIALIIKMDDGGSVLYKGKRIGKGLKPFYMYKFRTMKEKAEDIRNPDGSTYSSSNDPRLTRTGRWLRKTSVDELPQILNVIKGNMSFVGPRPSPPGNRNLYPNEYFKKFSILPGITGYHQVLYRNRGGFEERKINDLFYVTHISFGLDLLIVLRTLGKVLKRSDIHRNE